MFQEVWGRSFCRTIEKLVEVVHEYPTEVEHIYSPSCVPLVRCAGCCGDENLECHPTQTTNVTMQVRDKEHRATWFQRLQLVVWRNQNVHVKLKGKNVFCMCRGWMTESSRTTRVNISKWPTPVCWSVAVASCNFVYWSSELAFVPQLLKIRPSESEKEYVEMTFVEHQTCECR